MSREIVGHIGREPRATRRAQVNAAISEMDKVVQQSAGNAGALGYSEERLASQGAGNVSGTVPAQPHDRKRRACEPSAHAGWAGNDTANGRAGAALWLVAGEDQRAAGRRDGRVQAFASTSASLSASPSASVLRPRPSFRMRRPFVLLDVSRRPRRSERVSHPARLHPCARSLT